MVNDDSPLYTLEIRWELHKIGTYFLPIYKGSVRGENSLCHLLKWPPKQNLPRSGRRSWTSSAFGASISLIVRIIVENEATPLAYICLHDASCSKDNGFVVDRCRGGSRHSPHSHGRMSDFMAEKLSVINSRLHNICNVYFLI